MIMKPNVGTTDRLLRISVALLLVMLYFTEVVTNTLGIVLLVVATSMVVTSIIRFCPAYTLLGINTCKVQKTKQ